MKRTKTRTREVVYTVYEGFGCAPAVKVVHIVSEDVNIPAQREAIGTPQKGEKTTTCIPRRCKSACGMDVMDTRARYARYERRFQKNIEQSFDGGRILLLKKMLHIDEAHSEVSYIIVKNDKGYHFKGCNGNTVAKRLRGLRGRKLLEETGHAGMYIHTNGTTGTMETLEGVLHVCRTSENGGSAIKKKTGNVSPEMIEQSFDGGNILLLKKMLPVDEMLLEMFPGVSYIIVKNEKGYLFKACNGNTVAKKLWGLRGRKLLEETGHAGMYIHTNGSEGLMSRLSGALAVCRRDIHTVSPKKSHRISFKSNFANDAPCDEDLEEVLKIADLRPLLP